MKTIAIAAFFITTSSWNAFADECYPHEYLNDGDFQIQADALAAVQQAEVFKHENLNGWYVEVEPKASSSDTARTVMADGAMQVR